MSNNHLVLILAFAGIAFACGDDGEGRAALPAATTTASPTPTATPEVGAQALFSLDPLSVNNPFPTDRLRGPDDRVRISPEYLTAVLPEHARYNTARNYLTLVAEQLSLLEGFSTFAPVRVRVDGPVEIASGPNPPGILLFDLAMPYEEVAVTAAAVRPEVAGDFAIEIHPVVPLAPKRKYAFVVTRDVVDADGNPLRAAPDFRSAVSSGEPSELTQWRADIDAVRAALADRGIDFTSEVVVADVFTTQATTDDLISIRQLFDAGLLSISEPVFENSPVPELVTGIFPEGHPEFARLTGSPRSPTLAAVAVGSFASYDFRFGPQMRFDPDKVSGAVTPAVNHLDFYVTIPKAPPPPGGYPITIFGHGLGGSGRDAIGVSTIAGNEPMMFIGISDVEHGRRGSVNNFFNLVDIFATREHFRQTIADYLQLQRMVRNATVPPFDRIDRNRIHYMGVSLGGIMGTLYMGVEPDVLVAMLSVPGGGLPNILQSRAIGDLIKPLISLVTQIPLDDPIFPVMLHRFVHMAQWALDPADPINTAPYVVDPERRLPGVPPKRVLMHSGIVDTIVPNITTDDLARAMRLPDVKATRGCSSDAGCSGIWRFVMTEYGQPLESGHGVTFLVPQAFEQAREFLLSDGTIITDASP